MPNPLSASLPILAALALALPGCSTSNGGGPSGSGGTSGGYKTFCDLPVPCQQIAQACHSKDTGAKGPIHDCHVIGHEDGTLAACQPALAGCLKTCNDAPALSDGPVEDLGASCRDASKSDARP